MKSLLLLAVCAAGPILAQTPIQYSLSFPNAAHHEAEIRAVFSGVSSPVLQVVMSRSSPGRYALHEFAKNMYHIRAADASGHSLTIEHPDPDQWSIAVPADKTVVFEYTLFGDRADGTYDGIDETHAHLNMPATLVWARGMESSAVTVHFDLPQRDWKVATQMLPASNGDWHAPNLEWLMDCPVEISRHAWQEWKVEDATFRLSLHHRGTDAEAEHFARLCKAIVLEEEGIFGALPKYDDGTYTFLVDYLPYVSGDGMEHRDSTFITGTRDLSDDTSRSVEAVSHEFFHSWNVRRIRPKSLEPFRFDREDMSDSLWFAEGFTNYYGVLTLQRAGISALPSFLRSMGAAANHVINGPGRQVHNAIEMSELAPFVDAATSIDPNNFRNTFISYYTYGQALALGIDLAIRERFAGKSLDDWMRAMWRRHPDIDRPYTLADLQETLGEATGDAAFASEVFRRYIAGREAMNYAVLLAPAGLVLQKAHANQAWWGPMEFGFSADGAELKSGTSRGTPLYEAGLDRGDCLLEVNGKKVRSGMQTADLLNGHTPGETLKVKVRSRGGAQRDLNVTLAEDPTLTLHSFEELGREVNPQIDEFRKAWLGDKSLHALPDLN